MNQSQPEEYNLNLPQAYREELYLHLGGGQGTG